MESSRLHIFDPYKMTSMVHITYWNYSRIWYMAQILWCIWSFRVGVVVGPQLVKELSIQTSGALT